MALMVAVDEAEMLGSSAEPPGPVTSPLLPVCSCMLRCCPQAASLYTL